jgi:beta-lactamase class A
MPLSRRAVFAGLSALPFAACTFPAQAARDDFAQAVGKLEHDFNGLIGISAILPDGTTLSHRANKRFAYCSMFKWMLAATVLQDHDRGRLNLGQKVIYSERDLLSYAPVARAHVADGFMTIGDLCSATVSQSDNTAAVLLRRVIGGTDRLTQFVRDAGDKITRFDRDEPELNSNILGDPRDTTTPAANTQLLRAVIGGSVLSEAGKAQMASWMEATTTGLKRIRAAVPQGWAAGDKTGTSGNGQANDCAFIRVPGKSTAYITVLCRRNDEKETDDAQQLVMASAAKLVIDRIV